MYTLRNFITTR